MLQRRPLTLCAECGEWLYDGDTVYTLLGRTYCCACVRAALTVCRPEAPCLPVPARSARSACPDPARAGTTRKGGRSR